MFFVLSGYLITSLLLTEWNSAGRISFTGFYLRRVARLAPAYLLMIALTVPLMLGPLHTGELLPAPVAAGLSAVYAANWADAVHANGMGPLEHTWSLSVEEQFYLLWPVAMVALVRRRRSLARWLAAAVVVMAVGRFVWWATTHSLWPFFATFTRGDGLLVGCLLAVLLRRAAGAGRAALLAPAASRAAAWAGVVVLGALMATSSIYATSTYAVGLTAAGLATAAVVHHVVTDPRARLARWLSWRPLTGVGRVSYGVYLFHLPLFMLVWTLRLPSVAALALQFGLLAALTTASWFLLERPVQRWARRRPVTAPAAPAAPAAASGPTAVPPGPAVVPAAG